MFINFSKYNIFRVLTRKTTYIAILIVTIGSMCTWKRNSILYSMNNMNYIGGLNLFIFSSIKNNGIMSVLAPFVVMLVYPDIIFEDIQNHYVEQLRLRISIGKYYMLHAFQSFFVSGGIYVIAHSLILAICFCISPQDSVMIAFLNGPFSGTYYRSLTLYCILFIAHSFFFGGVMGILGMGLAMNLQNKCVLWTLPTLIYYLGFYLLILFPEAIQTALIYIIPLLPYEITTFDIPAAVHISQIIFIAVLGFFFVLLGIQRNDAAVNLYKYKKRSE